MPKTRDYDKRIFRLLSILNKLNDGGKVSCRELAGEFNVSLRTIQRDLEILDRAGFLLTSPEKGVWAFVEGFSLRKMKLTAEEASLLGFLGDISRSLGGKFEWSFQNILKKVLQQEYDSPFYAKMPQGIGIGKDAPFIQEIEEAVGESRKILLKYRHGGKVKTYKLRPLKIISYEGFWYLLAQAEGRETGCSNLGSSASPALSLWMSILKIRRISRRRWRRASTSGFPNADKRRSS